MMRSAAATSVASLLASLLLVTPAHADGSPPPAAIELSPGGVPTMLHGGIARGETARYTFEVGEDDWVTMTLRSVEDNAVVLVYGPGWSIGDNGEVVRGATEMQLGGDAGTSAWSGMPAAGGTHLMVVGSDRGGAEFDLAIGRRPPEESECVELSQGPMNACFAALAHRAESAYAKVHAALEAGLEPERRRALAAVERAWRTFVDAQCAFEAADYEGGSLQPTIASSCRLRHLTARASDLERLLETDP